MIESADDKSPASAPSGPRGKVLLAWIVIVLVGGALAVAQNFDKSGGMSATRHEGANMVVVELQMRMLVGALPEEAEARKQVVVGLISTVNRMNVGSIDQRLRAIIALGEIAGVDDGKKALEDLQKLIETSKYELSEDETENLGILTKTFEDYADRRPGAPELAPRDRQKLLKDFGWFGDLALGLQVPVQPGVPPEPPNSHRTAALAAARWTFVVFMSCIGGALLGLAAGIMLLTAIVIRAAKGKWQSALGEPVPHQGVYAETFAVWLVLFNALNIGGQLFNRGGFVSAPTLSFAVLFGSLLSLAWPVLRGVSWRQVRHDVGLTFGRVPLLEPSFGLLSYFAAMPVVAAAAILVLFLPKPTAPDAADAQAAASQFQSAPMITHPIIEQFRSGDIVDWLPTLLLACLAAPIVEEIAFRGLLYRHLRDATRRWAIGALFSMLVASIAFAVIHPQGFVAVPILASVAFGFTLAREWRGTLIPGMIAHAINNTAVMALLILCLMR